MGTLLAHSLTKCRGIHVNNFVTRHIQWYVSATALNWMGVDFKKCSFTLFSRRDIVKALTPHVDLSSILTLKIAYMLLLFNQVNLVQEGGICLYFRFMYRWNQWLWMCLQSWFCWFAVRGRHRRMSSSILRKWFVETSVT